MDGLVFIAALGVVVVIAAWYMLNEANGADGSVGALALRSDAVVEPDKEKAAEAGRYRARPRLAPGRSPSAEASRPVRAYRSKAAERAVYGEESVESDKEY